jgi:O-antigen/teichoic acid export membrane protein
MGIIQRQAIKNNIVSVLAVAVGVVSTLVVYPNDKALQGYIVAIASWALLLVPFVSLGTTAVMVRFLPSLEGDRVDAAGQLFTRAAAAMTAALVLLALVNGLAGDAIIRWLQSWGVANGVLAENRWTILGVLAALSYGGLLTTHLVNFRRIALPVVFNNLLVKLATPSLFLLIFYQLADREWLNPGIVAVYTLALLGLIAYAAYLGVLRFRWGKLRLKGVTTEDLYRLAAYSVFGAIGGRLSIYIDAITVNDVLGESETGIYAFSAFVVSVIVIPNMAINAITSPIVAEAWKEKDIPQLGFLYRETSLVLFALGGLIYAGALICLPHVYEWTDNLGGYQTGYFVVLFLGAAKLFDLLTSINGNLIGMTDYYRWNVVFIMVLGLLNVVLNYTFIAVWGMGITGAAIATMLASVLYNVLKVVLIQWKMGLQPLATGHLYIVLALCVFALCAWFVPVPANPFLSVLVRGSVLTLPFLAFLRYTNSVPPVRRLLKERIG